MLFSVAHVALAFTVQPRVAFMPRVSASTPPMMMASWSTVDGAGSRASCVSALNDLRDAGDATLWNSFRLAPRSVSLAEVCRTTKLEESVLDPTKTEYTLEDIQVRRPAGCVPTSPLTLALALTHTHTHTHTHTLARTPSSK